MENKLPTIYKNNFINKIKNWCLKIFLKKEEPLENITGHSNSYSLPNEEKGFQMKQEVKTIKLQEDIVDIIDKHPEFIENLTVSQLKELNKIYDKLIIEEKRKNIKLKRKLGYSN